MFSCFWERDRAVVEWHTLTHRDCAVSASTPSSDGRPNRDAAGPVQVRRQRSSSWRGRPIALFFDVSRGDLFVFFVLATAGCSAQPGSDADADVPDVIPPTPTYCVDAGCTSAAPICVVHYTGDVADAGAALQNFACSPLGACTSNPTCACVTTYPNVPTVVNATCGSAIPHCSESDNQLSIWCNL